MRCVLGYGIMRRKLGPAVYFTSVVVAVFMLLFIRFGNYVNEVQLRLQQEVEVKADMDAQVYQDATAPQGVRYIYEWEIADISSQGASICFYTIHENVKVWIDDVPVYTLHASDANAFGKTTGCNWPAVHLSHSDNGKTIRIETTPIYSREIGSNHEFYIGSYNLICEMVLTDSFGIIVLSIFAGIIGIVFIAFAIFYRNNQEVDRSLLYLGIFAIEMGLWKFCDMVAADLIFSNPLSVSAAALLTLATLPGSFILFIKRQFHSRNHIIWDVLTVECSVLVVVNVLLQATGVLDLRESLWVTHVSIVIAIIAILIMTVQEARKYSWSKKLRVTLSGIGLCGIGASVDLVLYYITGSTGNMVYALLAFLTYTLIMGFISIHEARALMEKGKEAKYFKDLALHDQLTGLYNRSYYKQYLDKIDYSNTECLVVMFDVNRLKICNDSFGHAEGDYLLRSAGRLIQQCFSEIGACCRIGGDEFCVLVKDSTEEQVVERLQRLQREIFTHNKSHPENFPIEIAHGYAVYDSARDASLEDTVRRADKLMYMTKSRMKNEYIEG